MGISTIKTVVVTTALTGPLAGGVDGTVVGTAAFEDVEAFATAAQGALAETAVQRGEFAETRTFTRANSTLATGQDTFAIPFTFLPGVSTVYLGGVRLTPGKHYDDSSGTSVVLVDPITELNDDLVIELLHMPSQQELRIRNTAQVAVVTEKLMTGAGFTMALEGDSIVYSQDTVNSVADTNMPINGASQRRSARKLEADLAEALSLVGSSVSVSNRGFPGDSTVQGLNRWAGAAAVNFVWIGYGHNDANNYGGNGVVEIAAFAANMELMVTRRIAQGAGVGIIIPANVRGPVQNAKLHAYRVAARMVAEKYGCPTYDAPRALQSVTTPWIDGVHLTSHAVSEMAWTMAASMMGGALRTISDGDEIAPDDGMLGSGVNATMFVDSRSRNGTFLTIAPGGTVLVAADFRDNVYPVINGYMDGADGQLSIFYAFGASEYRGVPVATFPLNRTISLRQSIVGPRLRMGIRMLAIRNDGVTPFFVEQLSFMSSPGHMTRGLARWSQNMHVRQPIKLSALSDTWWCHVDTSMRLKAPFIATWFLDTDDAANNGAAFWGERLTGNGDFVASSGVYIVRSGADLLVYEGGSAEPASVAEDVFSAGRQSVQLHVSLEDGDLKVWIDGASSPAITRTVTPITLGYPGLISAKTAYLESHGFCSNGAVKGPYA